MSELAFNLNGDPFDVPPNASGWRVRRMKQKGAPEVVYGRNGLPLVLPIEADLDDVRQETGAPGRYRLDPIDEGNRPIAGASAGYVYVHAEPQVASATSATRYEPTDNVVIEAMRMNSEIAKTVVDRFPQMLEAAALLLRAADGAGLPSREPRATDDDGEDDVESDAAPASSPTFELINNLVAQIVPVIVTSLASKGMPKLGAVLDWRKASPSTKPAPDTAPVVEEAPALDPAVMAKVVAIQSQLTPAEGARARQLAAGLSPAELRAWFDELSALPTPDAVAKIRGLLNGGAS
ncbi:MAG TPA: hypothetical protein VGG74_01510 [Kofleriaceae bacterium]|jgi:hypothetical protein